MRVRVIGIKYYEQPGRYEPCLPLGTADVLRAAQLRAKCSEPDSARRPAGGQNTDAPRALPARARERARHANAMRAPRERARQRRNERPFRGKTQGGRSDRVLDRQLRRCRVS